MFSLSDGRLDPSFKDTFYSIEPAERSAAVSFSLEASFAKAEASKTVRKDLW